MMRGVSEIYAFMGLLVVAIIAIFVAANLSAQLFKSNQPKGGDLAVSASEAYISGDVVVTNLRIYVVTASDAVIQDIELYKGDKLLGRGQVTNGVTRLEPGNIYDLTIKFTGITGINPGDTLVLLIRWQDVATGKARYTETSVTVR
jgi:hypothetical protein